MNKELYVVLFLTGIMTVMMGYGVFLILSYQKCKNTYNVLRLIMMSIYLYRIDMSDKNQLPEVYYDDMESFREKEKRWWDWGYKRILSPDKYELIKPYIKEAKTSIKNSKKQKEK